MTTTKKSQLESKPDFGSQLNTLESIVKLLEDDNISLEDSLEAFEKGIGLTRNIQKALLEAEQKVEYLLMEGESVESLPTNLQRGSDDK
jgi:exodeoxyribonuclease VII small subunit